MWASVRAQIPAQLHFQRRLALIRMQILPHGSQRWRETCRWSTDTSLSQASRNKPRAVAFFRSQHFICCWRLPSLSRSKFKMGVWMSRLFSGLFGKKEVRILILGLDNAGKTTILCMWLCARAMSYFAVFFRNLLQYIFCLKHFCEIVCGFCW